MNDTLVVGITAGGRAAERQEPYLVARGRARRAPGGAQQHPLVVRRCGEAGVADDPLSHSPPTHRTWDG